MTTKPALSAVADPIVTARLVAEICVTGFVARVHTHAPGENWERGAVAATDDGWTFYVVIRGARCRVAVTPEP